MLLAFGPGSPAKGGKENSPQVKVHMVFSIVHIMYILSLSIQMPDYLPETAGADKTDDKVPTQPLPTPYITLLDDMFLVNGSKSMTP